MPSENGIEAADTTCFRSVDDKCVAVITYHPKSNETFCIVVTILPFRVETPLGVGLLCEIQF